MIAVTSSSRLTTRKSNALIVAKPKMAWIFFPSIIGSNVVLEMFCAERSEAHF